MYINVNTFHLRPGILWFTHGLYREVYIYVYTIMTSEGITGLNKNAAFFLYIPSRSAEWGIFREFV